MLHNYYRNSFLIYISFDIDKDVLFNSLKYLRQIQKNILNKYLKIRRKWYCDNLLIFLFNVIYFAIRRELVIDHLTI